MSCEYMKEFDLFTLDNIKLEKTELIYSEQRKLVFCYCRKEPNQNFMEEAI